MPGVLVLLLQPFGCWKTDAGEGKDGRCPLQIGGVGTCRIVYIYGTSDHNAYNKKTGASSRRSQTLFQHWNLTGFDPYAPGYSHTTIRSINENVLPTRIANEAVPLEYSRASTTKALLFFLPSICRKSI